MSRAPWAIAALALVGPAVRGQGEPKSVARISSLPLGEGFDLEEILVEDVDGGGGADLVVASTSPSTRRLELHLRRAGGPAFEATADATLDLTPDVVAFAVGDVHADPGREVVLFNAGAIFAWRWRATAEKERFVKLTDVEFLWQWPGRRNLFAWQAGLVDLDRDGLADFAIPGPWSYQVSFQRRSPAGAVQFTPPLRLVPGDADEARGELDIDRPVSVRGGAAPRRGSLSIGGGGVSLDGENQRPAPWITVRDSVPAAQCVDWDGDGDLDCLFLTVRALHVFVQDPPGAFQAPLALVNPVVIDRARRLDVSYTARALDLDRDGRADALVSAGDKRSSDVRTQVLVFLQRGVKAGEPALFGAAGLPTQVLVLDGFARPLAVEDVDGDGLPDLVAGAIKPDLIDGIRAATSERIDAEIYVYRNTRSGFSKRPDLTHKLSIQAGGLDFTARFFGDLDGDGVSEFLERAEKDKLRVHLVRRSKEGLGVIDRPLFEMIVSEDARIVLPARFGPGASDVFVVEKGTVRCASFR